MPLRIWAATRVGLGTRHLMSLLAWSVALALSACSTQSQVVAEDASVPAQVRADDKVGATAGPEGADDTRAGSSDEGAPPKGSLPRSVILRVVTENTSELVACYEAELRRDPTLAGQVNVRFRIANSGDVDSVSVSRSTLDNPIVESCIVANIARWRFPEPEGDGIVVVNYPTNFSRGGEGKDAKAKKGAPVLDAATISNIVKANEPQLQKCYQETLEKHPSLAGDVAVKFTIENSGAVTDAVVMSSTLQSSEVESCITYTMLTWRFPPSADGDVVATKTFAFRIKQPYL